MKKLCLPADDIVREHFDNKLSVQKIAALYGVSRDVIVRTLQEAGHTQRGRGSAMRERMAAASPEQRLAWSEAAHAAVRGKPVPHSIRVSQAEGRSGKVGSVYEQRVGDALRQCGLVPISGYAVDIFNLDIAFPEEKLAIEVDGGNWHTSPRKASQDAKKLSFLLRSGWTLDRIQVTKKTSDSDLISYAQKVVALLQVLRGQPRTV